MSKDLHYTAPVRRGFLHILRYLQEDCTMHIFEASHPMNRRLKGEARAATLKALQWLYQEGVSQNQQDLAKRATEAPPEDPTPT